MKDKVIILNKRYRIMLKFYSFFMLMFTSTIASASTGQENTTTFLLLGAAFLLTVPVLIHNFRLHLAIKAVNPASGSVGLANAVLSSLIFTPFEAALVQPPINLTIARGLLGLHADKSRTNRE